MQVVEQVTKRQKEEIAQIEHLMARILKHVQGHALEAEHLLRDDGSPNIERIQQYFLQFKSLYMMFFTNILFYDL